MSERACGDRAGTHAGIDRHKAAGEALCATCAEFRRVYNQQYQMARRRAMGMRPRELQPCGTKAAAARHRRRGEKLCDPCLAAETAARRDYPKK